MAVVKANDQARQAWAWIKYQAQGKGWLLDPSLRGVNDAFASDVVATFANMRKNLTQQRRFIPAENLPWWINAYSRVIGGENKQASAVLRLIHKVVVSVPSASRPAVIRELILTPGRPEYETDRTSAPTTKTKSTKPAVKQVAKAEDPGPNFEKIPEAEGGSNLFWLAIGVGIVASML